MPGKVAPAGSIGTSNVYVRDLVTRTTAILTLSATDPGMTSNGTCAPEVQITPDGRYVAFKSTATNLQISTWSYADGSASGWVYDRQFGALTLVDVAVQPFHAAGLREMVMADGQIELMQFAMESMREERRACHQRHLARLASAGPVHGRLQLREGRARRVHDVGAARAGKGNIRLVDLQPADISTASMRRELNLTNDPRVATGLADRRSQYEGGAAAGAGCARRHESDRSHESAAPRHGQAIRFQSVIAPLIFRASATRR